MGRSWRRLRRALRAWLGDPEVRALAWVALGLWLLFQMGVHYPVLQGVQLPPGKCAGTVVVEPNILKIQLHRCRGGER